MFKNFIEWLIEKLDILHKILSDAYFETFGYEKLATEFCDELHKRKYKNKCDFLNNAISQITKDILKKDNYLIPPATALVIANRLFDEAKSNGDLDELNKLKTKEK